MIGETISHYRILAPLGAGGMGVVYEAEDTRLGRRVAIKLLPEAVRDPQSMERFFREARIVSSLNHPHICTLYDIGDHAGQQFMVMELLEGDPLKARLGRGPLRFDDVLELGVQIADALDAAHAQGVVHRDVKPANLFITRRGQIKVLDFGIAKLPQTPSGRSDETVAGDQLTTVGSAIGTVSYMSPEQARGLESDARSDLFSLGIVLYEMATGRTPFPGNTTAVIFEGILTKMPVAASELNAEIPPELDRIIFKALDKDRETRYQTAADIRADLKRLKRDSDTGQVHRSTVGAAAASIPRSSAGVPAGGPALSRSAGVGAAGPASRRRALFIGAPLVTAGIVGAFLLWQATRTPALTSRDTVVLADFVNRTGDTVFDDTLGEALAVQLRQSPFLNLLSDQQVQSTLRLMGQDPQARVTSAVGRDLCQRVGAKAALGGTIAAIGNAYLLTLNAHDCVSGDILAESQVQVSGKEEVIRGLGTAATEFRERLGESLASVRRFDAKIDEATTPSIEALKSYSQGMTVRRTKSDDESVPFFKRAIELDPEFALAYARLGTVYSNMGDADESRKVTQRAFDLRQKVSERERLYIEARYYTTVAEDYDKTIESYKVLLASFPTDAAAYTNISLAYRRQGKPEEAIKHLLEAVRLAPDQPLGWLNLGYAYIDVGKLDAAKRALEETLKIHESTSARVGIFQVASLAGDRPTADAQVEAMKGRRDESSMFAVRAQAAAYAGRMGEAASLIDEVDRRSIGTPRRQFLGEAFLGLGISFAVTGARDRALHEVERVERAGLMRDGATDEALVVAAILEDRALAAKYFDRAVAHIKTVGKPADAVRGEKQMRALAALAERRYPQALELMEAAGADPDNPEHQFGLGLVRLKLQQWPGAVDVFQRAAERRFKFGLSPLVAVIQVLLGRAQAGAGNVAAARAAYEEAFRIWKDADPELPLLVEAKAEYAALAKR